MSIVRLVPESATEPDLRSVPKLLRTIADRIDAGEYGIREHGAADCVVRGALVLRISGQPPQVYGLGDTDPSTSFLDFHAGASELLGMSHPERV